MSLPTNPVFLRQRSRLLELLTELSFQERDVVLSSGLKSNFYIDCKQTTLHAEGHFLVGQLFRAVIDANEPTALAIGGLTMGADPIASAISLVSFVAGKPLHAFYVRKEPKGHGTEEWLEGTTNLTKNMPVVILEDVVTTGASTLRAIERSRGWGLDVRSVVALVDRREGGREAVEKECPLISLYGKEDFLP